MKKYSSTRVLIVSFFVPPYTATPQRGTTQTPVNLQFITRSTSTAGAEGEKCCHASYELTSKVLYDFGGIVRFERYFKCLHLPLQTLCTPPVLGPRGLKCKQQGLTFVSLSIWLPYLTASGTYPVTIYIAADLHFNPRRTSTSGVEESTVTACQKFCLGRAKYKSRQSPGSLRRTPHSAGGPHVNMYGVTVLYGNR